MKNQNLLLFLLLFMGNMVLYGQCGVNAGGGATICGTSYTLQGSSQGSPSGVPVWTIVSKPSGAPDPLFSDVNSYTPNVTGMTSPGNYVFQIAQNCPDGVVTSQVTIKAPGDVSTFTAGPDITNVNATTGTVTLNGVVPAGYTASWSAYNIYNWERSTVKNSQNAQFSSTTSATTTFSLIKKANHDVDPAYVVTLRITSTVNPNCWYEDTAIVRFIPNPQILPQINNSQCLQATGGLNFVILQNTSPVFSKGYSGSPGSSGNFGTTITMNVSSQPAGGNIAFQSMYDNRIFLNGINAVGDYKFTLKIENASGTYTTPLITYTFNGYQPNNVSFLTPSRPDQMMIYSSGSSGGEVHCNNLVGLTAPITVLFSLNPSDPVTYTSTVANAGTTPPGGVPGLSAVSGSGTSANRSFTVTPPSGGWRVGTYKITVTTRSGGACNTSQSYYIHISDGNRPDVTVPNTTVCYPGSGVVTATIPFPDVYKGVVNTSYFQDFDGRYELTLISSPAGAAAPVFEPFTDRKFTNTSTTISNLNKEGEYVFRIKAVNYNPDVGAFLTKEYACSGASLESTFSIFVSAQVGANAGSNQNVTGTTTTLNGNNPGVATGTWTVVSKPAGVSNPVIVDPSLYNSAVTGLTGGTYVFRWSIATGTCISTSDVTINVVTPDYCTTGCNENTYLNASDPNTIEYDNLVASDNAIVAKEKDGTFKIWGYRTSPKTDPSNSNVSLDLLTPTAITPANGFNYTGTPLFATVSGVTIPAALLLTTDGLYGWGAKVVPYTKTTNNTTPAFGKITIDGKTDGLPPGVLPEDVKMMFQTYGSLTIVTCKGEAWTMNGIAGTTGDIYHFGDGSQVNTANMSIWHRVKTSATETLDNVVAVRGASITKFALTSEGKLYTWGLRSLIGDGSDFMNPGGSAGGTDRAFATEVVVPAGITPKMIGMTETGSANGHTYYLLATNGQLFAMGNNSYGQLGDGTTTNSNVWKEVTATSGGQTLGGNIAWISPAEHGRSTQPAINVLTNTKKQWGWGSNDSYKLGQPDATTAGGYPPTYMPGNSTNTNGMGLNDEIIAVETGGRFTINYKKGNPYFGFVGSSSYGTIGNGTTGGSSFQKYTYNTGLVDICSSTSIVCDKPGMAGTPLLSSVGILTKEKPSLANWPESVPNGYLVLDGAFKGMVINRMTTAQINALNPVDGMLVFDTDESCVKLYRGTTPTFNPTASGWVCITRVCIDTN